MDLSLLIPLLVLLFGMVFLYFVGAVIIQALRLSILQVKSDVKIKMEQHYQDLEQNQLMLDSKRLMLKGKTEAEGTKRKVTTIEFAINGDPSDLKEALESLKSIKKFAIFKENILLDIEGEASPTKLIEEIEKRAKVSVSQVSFAKNTEMTNVKDSGS